MNYVFAAVNAEWDQTAPNFTSKGVDHEARDILQNWSLLINLSQAALFTVWTKDIGRVLFFFKFFKWGKIVFSLD